MKIVIFCAIGSSAHMLAQRMKEEAQRQGKDYEIIFASLQSAERDVPDSDAVLIAPQVQYAVRMLRKKYKDKPIIKLGNLIYGTMDGKAALRAAEDAVRDW